MQQKADADQNRILQVVEEAGAARGTVEAIQHMLDIMSLPEDAVLGDVPDKVAVPGNGAAKENDVLKAAPKDQPKNSPKDQPKEHHNKVPKSS